MGARPILLIDSRLRKLKKSLSAPGRRRNPLKKFSEALLPFYCILQSRMVSPNRTEIPFKSEWANAGRLVLFFITHGYSSYLLFTSYPPPFSYLVHAHEGTENENENESTPVPSLLRLTKLCVVG
jgi:hypothetical protein